ncbi:LysR substrate-binding domain-containing protein [Alishewanella longhuensis]
MEIQQQGSPLSVNNSTAQLTATLSGLGVSQLPLFMAQPFLFDNGKLQLVLPDWQRAAFPLYLIYPPGRHLSGRLMPLSIGLCKCYSHTGRIKSALHKT